MYKHNIPSHFLTRPVDVALIGVGGTGSQILSGLARLHLAMLSLGHPHGLTVSAFDPDTVSLANVGRQLFYTDDIEKNKAQVLIDRINLAYRLNWEAIPERFHDRQYYAGYHITIGCVDSRVERRNIQEALKRTRSTYYLDCGNGPDHGQVIIGCRDEDCQLPMPWEICPDLVADIPEDNTPSCSLAEALGEQELFINQTVANSALQLLWSLFRHGGLDYCGSFINLKTGITRPISIPSTNDTKTTKKRK